MQAKHALHRAVAGDVFEAFRALVMSHDVPALAARVGMNPGTLYNKASASDESHHQPTLRDVVLLTLATGDMRVVEELAQMFGRATFDCTAHGTVNDDALLDLVVTLAAENGDFHRELSAGLQQQRFSAAALKRIRAEAFDMVSALMTLVRRLEDYVDAD